MNRSTVAENPPSRRLALAAMASNTGCASEGEAGNDLQDFGRRGLALECLAGLIEQPHILDRNHRLIGKGPEQRDGLIGVAARLGPAQRDRPDRLACEQHRHGHLAAGPHRRDHFPRQRWRRLVLVEIGEDVGRAGQHDPSDDGVVRCQSRKRSLRLAATGHAEAVAAHHVNEFAVIAIHPPHPGAAQPHRALDDDVEHRLHVRRGGGNDLEDVGRRGLPLQCFPCLVEQPRVLDGDRRLVGEALQERKFLRGERLQLVAIDDEGADRLVVAPQRRAAHGAGAGRAGMRRAWPIRHRRIDMVEVRDVNLPVPGNHLARQVLAADPHIR